jgi:RNA polymerase sigma factor (sigma-70 family)
MPERELSDEEVVRACLEGDAKAWSVLVRRYDKLVYNIALRSGLFADDAADVSQIVFVTIYRNLHLLERAASLSSWISMIARREAWRAKRRLTRSPTSSDSDAMESAAATPAVDSLPDEEVDRIERRFLVHRALERLDDRCRRLLEFLFLSSSSLSYEDSARALGIPRGSIGPTRARCLEKLKKILEELGF